MSAFTRFGATGPTASETYFGLIEAVARTRVDVNDLTHAHEVDDSALTVTLPINVSDATHGHIVDDASLGIVVNITVADARHAQIVNAVPLDQTIPVAVSSLTHVHQLTASTPVYPNPAITSITAAGTNPRDNETGVVISGTNFLPRGDGAVSYNAPEFLALTVTRWDMTQIEVSWAPIYNQGGSTKLQTPADLVVTRDGGAASAPFSASTDPQAGFQYVQISTRESQLDPGEGLFDDDINVQIDADFVYGFESPADGLWDFSRLTNHFINNVPNDGEFSYRIWDESLGEWSNIVTPLETFRIEGQVPEIMVVDPVHGHQVTDPAIAGVVYPVTVNDARHAHFVGDPAVSTPEVIGVGQARNVQQITPVTVAVHVPVNVDDATHGHVVTDVSFGNIIAVDDLSHTTFVTDPLLTTNLEVAKVEHGHIINSPTVYVDQPPILTVPFDRTLFYPDPPGTGVPQDDPVFQAWLNSATAFDTEDGDITGSITNNANSLTYPLTAANTPQLVTWSVTDSAGQTVFDSRLVRAIVGEAPEFSPTDNAGLRIAISLEI